MSVLTAMAVALMVCGVTGHLTRRIPRYRGLGLVGIAEGLLSIQSIREGDWLRALLLGAVCAVCLYGWWRGGGGDGTRRRLRHLRRHFQGVRRTAPTLA